MSRRRSRLPHASNSDGESTLEQFLMKFATRTLRTPRNRRRFNIPAGNAPPTSSATLNTCSWDGGTAEADTIPETLGVIERDEAKQQEPIRKPSTKRRNLKRPNTDDAERCALIGNKTSGSTIKRRRKHYVVCNSLPLSRDLQNNRFNFSMPIVEPCDSQFDQITTPIRKDSREISNPSAKHYGIYGCNTRPLLPLSVIRGMLVPTRRNKKESPANLSNRPTRLWAITPSRPGSGFYCVNDNDESSISATESVSHDSSPCDRRETSKPVGCLTISSQHITPSLPSVPEIIRASSRPRKSATSEINGMAEHREQMLVELKSPVKKREANDSTTHSEKRPLVHGAGAFHTPRSFGLRISETVNVETNPTISSPGVGDRDPKMLIQLNAGTHESVEDSCGLFVPEVPRIPYVIGEPSLREFSESSHDTYQTPSIQQEDLSIETKSFLGDSFKQSKVLAYEIVTANLKSNERFVTGSIRKGSGKAAKQNPNGDSTVCKMGGVKANEKLFTPSNPQRKSARPEARTSSLSSFTKNSFKTTLGQAAAKSKMETPLVAKSPSKMLQGSTVEFGQVTSTSVLQKQGPSTYPYQQERSTLTNEREGGDEDEDEPTLSVSRRLFTMNPTEGSYFSTARRVLENNLDSGANSSSAGYLRRSSRITQYFPIFDNAIDEENEQEQRTSEDNESLIKSTIPTDIYNLNCATLSKPRRSHTLMAQVALKDLLRRTGNSNTRRPSISGIFRGKNTLLVNSKPVKPTTRDPRKEITQATGVDLIRIPNPLTPNPSGFERAYRSQINPHLLRPYISPVKASSLQVVGNNDPGKWICQMTMASRLETPIREELKSPLVNNRVEALGGNGARAARSSHKRSRADLLKRRGELEMKSPDTGIRRLTSSAAVREAW